MPHSELKRTALRQTELQADYEALGPEFESLRQMLQVRESTGLTQVQVAEHMGTKPPAVARLESSSSRGKHLPSPATLRKYAAAVGYRLEVRLVRAQTRSNQGMEPTR